MTTVEENIAFQDACRQWGEAMLPLLSPGAIVLMFGGTRMFEWLNTGMQLEGFEHWETINWLHSQGFPKAQDISKLIDKANGDKRGEVIGTSSGPNHSRYKGERYSETRQTTFGPVQDQPLKTAPGSPTSAPWSGHKTCALNPAWEPILCFRAPRQGMTYAEIALKFGSGALNVDGTRLPSGRYPANLILDEESAAMLGEWSRFFYCAKASSRERNAGCEDLPNDHPTVKPLALCRHLATLLLPPPSVAPRRLWVPFCGSGSEMIGAMQAGWDEIVGVEQNPDYCQIADRRLEYWRKASVSHDVLPLASPGRTDAA